MHIHTHTQDTHIYIDIIYMKIILFVGVSKLLFFSLLVFFFGRYRSGGFFYLLQNDDSENQSQNKFIIC